MAKIELRQETYLPQGDERDLAALSDFVSTHEARDDGQETCRYYLGTGLGETVEIPDGIFRVLRQVVATMGRGMAVTVVPQSQTLTTQQAAELLGVSRPTLIRLLNAGKIPFDRVGAHRRLLLRDVLEHREQRRLAQYQALEVTSVDIDSEHDFQRVIETLRDARKQVAVPRHTK